MVLVLFIEIESPKGDIEETRCITLRSAPTPGEGTGRGQEGRGAEPLVPVPLPSGKGQEGEDDGGATHIHVREPTRNRGWNFGVGYCPACFCCVFILSMFCLHSNS